LFLALFIEPGIVYYGLQMPDDFAGFMVVVVYKFVLYGIISIMVINSKITTKKNFFIFTTIAFIFFVSGGKIYTSIFGLILMLFVNNLITLNESAFLNAIKFIFVINLLVTVAQILGIADFFYYHMFYFPEGTGYTNILQYNLLTEIDHEVFSTPQMRPSGIFPSTIYYTFFHMIVFYLLIVSEKFKSRWYIIFAFSSIISGSSAILLIVSCSLVLVFNNIKLIFLFSSYVLFMLIGFSVQYPWFAWSYNVKNITDSFFSRGYDLAGKQLLSIYAMYQSSFISFMIVSLVLGYFLQTSIRYVFIVVIILLPLVIHNLYHFIGYLFLISIVFTYATKSNEKRKPYRAPALL
jgi:hypothetical protein